jgi:hypothetical protein
LVNPEDKINDDDHANTQVYEEAQEPVDEDEDNDEDDSTIPQGEDNLGRDDILSKDHQRRPKGDA